MSNNLQPPLSRFSMTEVPLLADVAKETVISSSHIPSKIMVSPREGQVASISQALIAPAAVAPFLATEAKRSSAPYLHRNGALPKVQQNGNAAALKALAQLTGQRFCTGKPRRPKATTPFQCSAHKRGVSCQEATVPALISRVGAQT